MYSIPNLPRATWIHIDYIERDIIIYLIEYIWCSIESKIQSLHVVILPHYCNVSNIYMKMSLDTFVIWITKRYMKEIMPTAIS